MKTPPETFERLHKVFSAAHPASVLYFADRSVCSTVEILDLLDDLEDAMTERDQLRAEVEQLKAANSVLGGKWCKEIRAAGRNPCGACAICCGEARAENEALREVMVTIERTGAPGGSVAAKRSDGHSCAWCRGMWTPCPSEMARLAIARLDAPRKEPR